MRWNSGAGAVHIVLYVFRNGSTPQAALADNRIDLPSAMMVGCWHERTLPGRTILVSSLRQSCREVQQLPQIDDDPTFQETRRMVGP